jgi:hypothetical protein
VYTSILLGVEIELRILKKLVIQMILATRDGELDDVIQLLVSRQLSLHVQMVEYDELKVLLFHE